jgi:hypothetical protein
MKDKLELEKMSLRDVLEYTRNLSLREGGLSIFLEKLVSTIENKEIMRTNPTPPPSNTPPPIHCEVCKKEKTHFLQVCTPLSQKVYVCSVNCFKLIQQFDGVPE